MRFFGTCCACCMVGLITAGLSAWADMVPVAWGVGVAGGMLIGFIIMMINADDSA